MTSRSVLQDWLMDLSLMQQSVLLTAVRGCDGLPKTHISKYVLRWLRRCILISAFDNCAITNPYDTRGGNFTGPIPSHVSVPELFRSYLAYERQTWG